MSVSECVCACVRACVREGRVCVSGGGALGTCVSYIQLHVVYL